MSDPRTLEPPATTDELWKHWRYRALKAEEDRRKTMLALEGLTPSGSEFVGDPDACVAYVRRTWDSNRNVIASFKDQRDKAIAERDIYKAAFDTAHNALMAASMQIDARNLLPEGKL